MSKDSETKRDEEGTPAQYLLNLAERLMKINGLHGFDEGDRDALRVIAEKIEWMNLDDLRKEQLSQIRRGIYGE
jgi:hypothetical protein